MNLIQRFLIFLFGLLILVLILRCMRQSVTFTAEKFSESNEVLENPYQGYYHIIGYTLNDTDEAIASHADTYSDSLVLLEINLKNYKNTDISETCPFTIRTDFQRLVQYRHSDSSSFSL